MVKEDWANSGSSNGLLQRYIHNVRDLVNVVLSSYGAYSLFHAKPDHMALDMHITICVKITVTNYLLLNLIINDFVFGYFGI